MKRIILIVSLFAIAISLFAAESPDMRIIKSADRIKELAIESRTLQKPEEIVTLLTTMHKEFLVILDANRELDDQKIELNEAQEKELDNALTELVDSIEVITITATQFKKDTAVSKALDDFETEMEKFGQ